ncbi:MAG: hypothetical protein R3285_05340, partial [Kiloniellales bacterium]|nr:hypothetical protein [Kiloniellales bacterium]
DSRPADSATTILSEFLAETDPLIDPNKKAGESVIAAGPPADAASAGPAKADGIGPETPQSSAQGAAQQPDKLQAAGPASEDPGEEESPALRRIMKRGRRAAG